VNVFLVVIYQSVEELIDLPQTEKIVAKLHARNRTCRYWRNN